MGLYLAIQNTSRPHPDPEAYGALWGFLRVSMEPYGSHLAKQNIHPSYTKIPSLIEAHWALFGHIMVHGPWVMVHGPWTIDHGPWSMDHGSWSMVHGP